MDYEGLRGVGGRAGLLRKPRRKKRRDPIGGGGSRTGAKAATSGSRFTNFTSGPIRFAMTKEGAKHHYLPKFYLKRWTNAKGELCEFRQSYKIVSHRMTNPDGTGYVRGLYTFDGLPPEAADVLETKFFMQTDTHASLALDQLLAHKVDLIEPYKSAWSRFIMTLMYRPLCQRSCRPDRIKTSGGAGRRTWLGMDRRLRTTRWRDCCRRRVAR